MVHRLNLLLLLCLFFTTGWPQDTTTASCGQQGIMQQFYAKHPEYRAINQQVEKLLAQRNRGQLKNARTAGPVTLPVVVHIIHNNGSENISDAQVFQGIQHLNEAYANTGYYDPADGVNTQIQFCMAQRDPANNVTNGITRDVSSYTVMGGPDYYSDDQQVKNINRWNPLCYINIWLVKTIPTSVVGYAYLPSAHGSTVDGIIIEAAYFGSSYSNDVVAAHEMGHYLGLYHTFEGGCSNTDCSVDGDRVCDTPPDQSTAGISCSSAANSCTTDILSGFATDRNDLTQDYMDYGNFNCMKEFTQGQSDRMNWFIQNVRKSLLACKSCINPCPAPVTADFTSAAAPVYAGTAYSFTNTSVNAASYEWYVNNVLQTTAASLSHTFSATGNYTIKLLAHSGNALCDDAVKTITVNAVCPVTAGFTKSAGTASAGTPINFINISTGADVYEWWINSVLQSSATNFSYTPVVAGDYIIQLRAKNSGANCQQIFSDTVHYTCPVITDFTPAAGAALVNTAVTFSSTGSAAASYQWFVNGTIAGTGASLVYSFTAVGAYPVQLVTGNGVCSASKTGIIYINDKCGHAQYQFQKNFQVGRVSAPLDIQVTPDGGAVLADRVINAAGVVNASILKLDTGGNPQWMNVYGAGTSSDFAKTKPSRDGGYISIGTIQAAGTQGSLKSFIVKTNAAGTITWSRDISIQGAFSNLGTDIIESSDGSYYFTGTINQPGLIGSTDVMAAKMDGSGNLQWIRYYDARSAETGNSLAEDNTHLVICGNKAGATVSSGFLLQLNKTDGSVVWARTYQSTDENFLSVQTTLAGYYINALRRNVPGGLFTDQVFLQTDFNGKPTYTSYIQPFGTAKGTGWASSYVIPNGHIVGQTTCEFGGTYTDFITHEIDPATGVVWSKIYNKSNVWLSGIATDGNAIWARGIMLEAGDPGTRTFVLKADSAGNTGDCPSSAIALTLSPAVYGGDPVNFTGKAVQAQVGTQHLSESVAVTTGILCEHLACDPEPLPVDTCKLCDTLILQARDTVCSLAGAVRYSVIKSVGCPAAASWRLSDTGAGSISTINDSTVDIIFNRSGVAMLYSSIVTGCKTITDSALIHVYQSPISVDLGPDIQLCSFSTLTLHAGAGFASYHWSDGSADSVLTAYNPGQYAVAATDYCGNIFRDTLNLSQGPLVPFDLGPDRAKCNSDTLTILAPGSFLSYTWAANYNISSVSGSVIRVWPATDTTYTVIAKVANGCTVIDTIRVMVKQSAPIFLGNDTSFCTGGAVVLKAPTGFSSYQWQDGSAAPVYNAGQPGLYWLHATASNGCVSKDSLLIKSVYPSPLHFLDPEAETCEGRNLTLKALGNWPSYLWSDNSTASSLTVNSAGSYWLQVTSPAGCIARDTVMVMNSQGCHYGIHFPNAFTPDQNNNNDVYRPVITGIPSLYRLAIYNRFGEKVFETTDYRKGWNGIYKGILQTVAGFAWICNYQFPGQKQQLEKGTLLLIR